MYKSVLQACSRPTGIAVASKPGYLSSLTSEETNCGTTEFPWVLESKKGQKINLTLTYFNWHYEENDQSPCSPKLGYLFDLDTEDIVNICGSTSRVTHLHTTEGNQVHVLLDRTAMRDSYFLIKFEGTVFITLLMSFLQMYIENFCQKSKFTDTDSAKTTFSQYF